MIKPTLSRMAITASMLLSLFVVSCGKKDTPESLSDEMVAQMDTLITALESAKDKASAEKAATKIDEVADEIIDLAGRLDALGEPSEDDVKTVKEKLDSAETDSEKRMMAALKAIMTNPEVAEIIRKAMEDFGKKVDTVESTYNKWGKE